MIIESIMWHIMVYVVTLTILKFFPSYKFFVTVMHIVVGIKGKNILEFS